MSIRNRISYDVLTDLIDYFLIERNDLNSGKEISMRQLNLRLVTTLRLIKPILPVDTLYDMDTLLVDNYYCHGEYLYLVDDAKEFPIVYNPLLAAKILLPSGTKLEFDPKISLHYYNMKFYLPGYPMFETKLQLNFKSYKISYCIACLQFTHRVMLHDMQKITSANEIKDDNGI